MKEFIVNDNHIKLLNKMIVGWQDCEYGAPEIDPKRPYGNSDVENDIMEILGWDVKKCPHCSEPLEKQDSETAAKLHKETQTVIEILLHNPTNFKLGTYVRLDSYGSKWRLK